MKNVLLTAALAGAAAGVVVLALGGMYFAGDKAAPARAASITPTQASGTSPALDQRLSKIEDRLDALAVRPAAAIPTMRESVDGESSAGELAALREELQELRQLTSVLEAPPSDNIPIGTLLQVESALDSIREKENRERAERRELAFNERLELRLAAVAKELNLSNYQVGELRRIETDSRTQRDELMRTARENEDWGNMRDTMRALRDDQATALTELFGEDLYGQYQESVGRGGLSGTERGRRGGDNNGSNAGSRRRR